MMANDISRAQCYVEVKTRGGEEKDAIESSKSYKDAPLRMIGRSQINRRADENVSPRLRRSRRTNVAERNARRCMSSATSRVCAIFRNATR